tara:strand:+ start:3651 stop:4268 length:618 start_codon:yes stop_codon:yes gene_type:complete
MNYQKRIAALLASATLLFSLPGSSSQRLDEALTPPAPETEETATETTTPKPEPIWTGEGFTATEQAVLLFLQERGITDRAALATILGNIKQESKFDTIICEGGRRTGYHNCHSGGFGLIQWTTPGRYRGLGRFSAKYNLDPNSLEAQLRWMVNEREWLLVKHHWETPGKSINGYMNSAYRWLGWGVHGARTSYAHSYYNALRLTT